MKHFYLGFLLLLSGLTSQAQVKPVSDAQLFNAFKQDYVHFEGYLKMLGGGGNCASIAVIKAAIGTFGINGVFKSVTFDPAKELVTATRRDNKVLVLSYDRMEDGKAHFFIKPQSDKVSQEISAYARFCFAVMCRAKQLDLGYDRKYFYRGVDDLNKGEAAESIYKLLGLQKTQLSDLSITNLSKFKHLVLYNAPHAVYSSQGNYDEFFRGTVTGIELLSKLSYFHCKTPTSCPILGAYALK